MSKSSSVDNRDLPTRIVHAAREILLEGGPRDVKSARVAEVAGVSQTTMFKYFDEGVADVLTATYDSAWGEINDFLMLRSFEHPSSGDPLMDLVSEVAALGDLADDPRLKDAAQVAFIYFRRPLLLGADVASPNQERFENRIERLCERYSAAAPDSDVDPVALRQLLVNFAVSWFFLHLFGDEASRLTEEDLRQGVRNLVRGFKATVTESDSTQLGSRR